MTPTLTILSERTRRLLTLGDIPRSQSIDDLDVIYLLRDEIARQIKGSWYEYRKEGEKNIDSRYVITLSAEVKVDPITKENYCDIPVSNWISLPDGSGIESVRPYVGTLDTKKSKDREIRGFIPIPNRFIDLYANLPAGALEGQVGFMIRGKKILFTKRQDERTLLDDGIKNVEIDIISVDPAAVGLDDVLSIPQDMIKPIILEVLITLGVPREKATQLTARA